MVENPEVDKEYEWRREGKEPLSVQVTGIAPVGEHPGQYVDPNDVINTHPYPVENLEIQEHIEVKILSGPDKDRVVPNVPRVELFEASG